VKAGQALQPGERTRSPAATGWPSCRRSPVWAAALGSGAAAP